MKIGILTFHYVYNYGAVLQGFALQTYLSNNGHDVNFINYVNQEVRDSYRLFKFNEYSKKHPTKFFKTLYRDVLTRNKYMAFHKSVNKLICISNDECKKNHFDFSNYDCIIVGSDQVWNERITGGHDYFYKGDFVKISKVKLLGYSVSINNIIDNYEFKNSIISTIENFDHLSIREQDSAKVLSQVCSRDIKCCLDPVFLLSKYDWAKYLTKKTKHNSDYILVYAILNREKVISFSKIISQKYGMRLIILDPIASYETKYRKELFSNPMDFVSLIYNARLIFTSSFHGTAFSIIFEKDFYIVGDDVGNVRMRSLLKELNIMNRIINTIDDVDINKKIDYKSINNILSEKLKSSKDFLNNSLYESIIYN